MDNGADWVTAGATVFLVIVTIIYVYFSYKLTQETIRLRKVETSPFISIIFDISFDSTSCSKITIKNIGKAPAYDVSFQIEEQYLQFFNGYNFKNSIEYFAPQQEFSILATGFMDIKKAGFNCIPISVKYKSKDGTDFKDLFNLKWQHFHYFETTTLQEIKKCLKDLNYEIRKINETLSDKKYFISNKLSILEMNTENDQMQFIFSNGKILEIKNEIISEIFSDIEKISVYKGDLMDFSSGKRFTAEELFFILTNTLNKQQ